MDGEQQAIGKELPSLDFYCIALPFAKLGMFGHKLERGALSLRPFQLMTDRASTKVCFQFFDIEKLTSFYQKNKNKLLNIHLEKSYKKIPNFLSNY